jgi:hypothetical protein
LFPNGVGFSDHAIIVLKPWIRGRVTELHIFNIPIFQNSTISVKKAKPEQMTMGCHASHR